MQHQVTQQHARLRQSASKATRSVVAQAATLQRQRQALTERQPRPENVEGSFYVDHTCIDCDTCRWMDGDTYGRINGQTAVLRQPETAEQRQAALQALLACPTFSIHCQDKQSDELRAAVGSFPKLVQGSSHAYHCGYASKGSFGAVSYLLVREGGNVLVDSPRFDSKLLKNIEALGGAKYMFLTHRDDVADHSRWAQSLGCQRIIHAEEATDSQQTTACEIQLGGEGPWQLPDGDSDVTLIFTPGHTEAHVVMHYQPEKVCESCFVTFCNRGQPMLLQQSYPVMSMRLDKSSLRGRTLLLTSTVGARAGDLLI